MAPVFFVVVAVLVVLAIALSVSSYNTRQMNDRFGRLALKHQGRIETGSMFSLPSVEFPYQGGTVGVTIHRTGGKNSVDYLRVHLSWPDPTLRCEIFPEGFFNRLGKLMGMQDIQIGSPEFDPRYIIQGNSEVAIRRILTPTVQLFIESLRSLTGNDDIYISFSGGELLVKKRDWMRDFSLLDRYVTLCLELYEQALVTAQTGIEFVEPATPPAPVRDAICQVCGEAIGDNVVYCRRCRTPHHRECWEYFGACSTYGCREVRFHRAGQRRA